ncbi:hypothetical protein [Pseudomonas aeruginosa]|uniref:hypothetical protein n=1 Tax=Pseudomonas aeruginosa TaxID=287 RepID=UPI000BB57466|nr:hypothetical protein [Pseudomonas aeruginosa]EKS3059444.1 hypothetical protein [Pseudomonas aeruginosa]PBN23836.1 hypothetical protein B8B65_28890 [Pseudomonas aeruginosa]
MGGNALASFGATRCSRAVALQVLEDFQKRFAQITCPLGSAARVEPIAAYRQKPDFGDLDVLVDSRVFKAMPPHAVVKALSSSYGAALPWVKNGPVLSVGLPLSGEGQCLQLDLISTPAAEFDFSLGYFSWNDLGNLVGRVAHKMGLKFGHDGLWLPMRDGTHLHDELLITRDFEHALHFLGFDVDRWNNGFDSLDDIYQFVANGKRFNPELYPLEHRNHTARVRDKKRPVYMGFLQWIEAQPMLRRFDWQVDKAVYLPEVFAAFPGLEDEYDRSLAKLDQAKAIRACFNGEVVSAVTGLEGKQLGEFMARFKREQGEGMNDLPTLPAEDLHALIRGAYQQYGRAKL